MAGLEPSRLLTFIQFPQFLRDWERLKLDDDDQRALEQAILAAPDKAPVMEHTGGLRKLRFAPPGSGKGKSGSYRVCYAHFPRYGTIALLVAFGKNERSDLTPAKARAVGKALKAFEAELRRQFGRRV